MDLANILEIFDKERRQLVFPGAIREASGSIVRHISRYSTESTIIYSAHTPGALDKAIADQLDYFTGLGHNFEWKVYSHDRPQNLVDRLRGWGFSVGPPETVVVAEVANTLSQLPELPFEVKRLTDPDDLDDYKTVSRQVWPQSGTDAHLSEIMRNAPDSIGLYVAYLDGVPVGSSRSSFHPQSAFAGLWGGAVLPEYRHKGVYRSMIGKRTADAQTYGARYLQVDARPTSRPILEKLGFQKLSVTYPCLWQGWRRR